MMKENTQEQSNLMSNTIRAVIWDLDGVIIDSANDHRLAWQRLAQEEGISFSDTDFWATFGKRNDAIFAEIWGPLPPERVQELANRKEAYFRELIRQTAAPLPGAMELMHELHEARYAQALASSTPIENIQLISDALGLERYFFFSSRRRHTRFDCDWSSDVCSSD